MTNLKFDAYEIGHAYIAVREYWYDVPDSERKILRQFLFRFHIAMNKKEAPIAEYSVLFFNKQSEEVDKNVTTVPKCKVAFGQLPKDDDS